MDRSQQDGIKAQKVKVQKCRARVAQFRQKLQAAEAGNRPRGTFERIFESVPNFLERAARSKRWTIPWDPPWLRRLLGPSIAATERFKERTKERNEKLAVNLIHQKLKSSQDQLKAEREKLRLLQGKQTPGSGMPSKQTSASSAEGQSTNPFVAGMILAFVVGIGSLVYGGMISHDERLTTFGYLSLVVGFAAWIVGAILRLIASGAQKAIEAAKLKLKDKPLLDHLDSALDAAEQIRRRVEKAAAIINPSPQPAAAVPAPETESASPKIEDVMMQQARERFRRDLRFKIDLDAGKKFYTLAELQQWRKDRRREVRDATISEDQKDQLFDVLEQSYNEQLNKLKADTDIFEDP